VKFEIKTRYGGVILFTAETDSFKLAVEAAVKSSADLGGADLRGAYLAGAYLGSADLRGADLGGAYLWGADLRGADLGSAYLGGADLCCADLRGADLGSAYLGGADLGRADLGDAKISLPNGSGSLLVGQRPIIRVGPVGSRADELLAFITDAGVFVRTGCFWGSLAEFEAKVAEMHGKTGPHAEEYHAAVGLIMWHAHHWTPAKTEEKAA
jgi:hypothetical protein